MIKPGVDLRGLVPQMVLAYTIAYACYARIAPGVDCVMTSASDGAHMLNSLHYGGKAIDLRTRTLTNTQTTQLLQAIQDALGSQFDVILEDTHLHLEWDVKDIPQVQEA